jgi:glycosyltransferase involved in cell wall biosynthesis
MKIVTILPAYNLEEEIQEIVERTKLYSDIVIVVSDGSTDKTWEEATKAGALCPAETDKLGMGFAVRKGIEYSKQFEPDIVVLMDADGQHLPEEIPKVIEPIMKEDVDTVVGSRTMGVLKTSTINRIGNFGLKSISFFVTGRWFTDTESGFRAYKAAKLYELDLEAEGYEIESDLFLKSLHKGHSIREVPITVPKAVPGVTVIDGFKMGIFKIKLAIRLKLSKEQS